MLFLAPIMTACVEDNADDVIDLTKGSTSITIKEGATISISLLDFNGHDIFLINNRDIVSARIEKEKLYLTGLQIGNATVILKDADGKQMIIEVTVINMKSH